MCHRKQYCAFGLFLGARCCGGAHGVVGQRGGHGHSGIRTAGGLAQPQVHGRRQSRRHWLAGKEGGCPALPRWCCGAVSCVVCSLEVLWHCELCGHGRCRGLVYYVLIQKVLWRRALCSLEVLWHCELCGHGRCRGIVCYVLIQKVLWRCALWEGAVAVCAMSTGSTAAL
eukprot:1161480-Pelagomonas_calceolata.AAC.25